VREGVGLLDDEITEATLKDYCNKGKLKCKRVGPKKRWMILGASLKELRRDWKLD
jgi:hypothetical protein